MSGWGISCETAVGWISLDLSDDKSILAQVMAWCRQATSHYLSQCWPRPMSPFGATRPQWVKSTSDHGFSGTGGFVPPQPYQSTCTISQQARSHCRHASCISCSANNHCRASVTEDDCWLIDVFTKAFSSVQFHRMAGSFVSFMDNCNKNTVSVLQGIKCKRRTVHCEVQTFVRLFVLYQWY